MVDIAEGRSSGARGKPAGRPLGTGLRIADDDGEAAASRCLEPGSRKTDPELVQQCLALLLGDRHTIDFRDV